MLRLINRYGSATLVGTRCIAVANGKKSTRIVLGGGSFGGDSDCRVHFGLGPASKADELKIRWLSGKTQVLQDVRTNQILTLKEPK